MSHSCHLLFYSLWSSFFPFPPSSNVIIQLRPCCTTRVDIPRDTFHNYYHLYFISKHLRSSSSFLQDAAITVSSILDQIFISLLPYFICHAVQDMNWDTCFSLNQLWIIYLYIHTLYLRNTYILYMHTYIIHTYIHNTYIINIRNTYIHT